MLKSTLKPYMQAFPMQGKIECMLRSSSRERTWTLRMEEFEIMFMKPEIERYI